MRRALTEPALRIMPNVTSEVRVTVLGSATGVTVSLLADADASEPADSDPAGAAVHSGVTVTRLVHGSKVWVEATWQPQG